MTPSSHAAHFSAPRMLAALLAGALAFGVCALEAPGDALAKPSKKTRASKEARAPIAYYLSQAGHKGKTQAAAIAKCRAEQARDRARLLREKKKHPNLVVSDIDPKACTARIVTVRGPYKRAHARGDEEAEIFVYKGSDGIWYDKDGEQPCFAPGTPIATPDGDRAIEDMKAGDPVLAYDVARGRVVLSTVERTKRRPHRRVGVLTFSDGTSVSATPNHPFYSVTARSFVEAGKLQIGDTLLELRGGVIEEVKLADKSAFDRDTEVYDLTIARLHDHFAGGVLVHNY